MTATAALFRGSINAIDRFNDLSDATGASIENISALDRVARQTGGSFETVSGVLIKFNSILNKTDQDGEDAARVLKAMGLNAEELKRIDPAEALRRTAVALSNFADDGNKARAVQLLFGKSVAEAAPFLKDLAEKTGLLATTSTKAGQEAEALNKKLFEMKANGQDAARALAVDLAPTISALSNEFLIGMKRSTGFLDALITFGTINPFRSQQGNLQALRDELDGLNKDRERYVRSGSDTRGIDDALRQTRRQLDYLKEIQLLQAVGSAGDTGDFITRRLMRTPPVPSLKVPDKRPTGGGGSVKDPQAEGKRYLETLQRQLDKLKELTIEEQALTDIQSGRIGKIAPALAKEVLGTARLIDLKKAEADAEKTSEKAAKDAAEAAGRLFEQIAQFTREVETPFERLQRQLDELARSVDGNPLLSADLQARLGTKYWKEYTDTIAAATTEVSKFDDYSKRAAEGIQDAIGDGLVDLMEGNFEDIGKGFTRMVNRMVAEAAAADIARKLFGSMIAGGTGEGLLGGLLNSMIGGLFGSGSSTLTTGDFARMDRRAIGGPVSAGRMYQVNERGPEIFKFAGKQFLMTGNQSGRVDPSMATQGAATVVNVHVTPPAGTRRESAMQWGSEAGRQIQRAMRRNG